MSIGLYLSRSGGLPRLGLPQRASFETWVQAALKVARYRRTAEISLRLVDAAEGRELNRRYRQRDYATNVLSFPADLPHGFRLPQLGDLVICSSVVEREAAEQQKTLRNHYAHLTIHGVLHLLGHDHERDADAERMESLERRALTALGIADPYS